MRIIIKEEVRFEFLIIFVGALIIIGLVVFKFHPDTVKTPKDWSCQEWKNETVKECFERTGWKECYLKDNIAYPLDWIRAVCIREGLDCREENTLVFEGTGLEFIRLMEKNIKETFDLTLDIEGNLTKDERGARLEIYEMETVCDSYRDVD